MILLLLAFLSGAITGGMLVWWVNRNVKDPFTEIEEKQAVKSVTPPPAKNENEEYLKNMIRNMK